MKYEQYDNGQAADFRARSAYADYLQSLHWDFFITVTFRNHWRDSIKAHEAVWNALHYDSNVKRAFLAVERHRYPNWQVHVHGLVSDYDGSWRPGMLLPWSMWENLFKRFGRTRVEQIRSSEDVSGYCAKYVTKRVSEYGFYGAGKFWDK